MDYLTWLNGEFVPRSEASVPISDGAYRTGAVVFDTERTFNGKVFRLEDHIDRLYRSLNYIRVDPGMTKREMADLTREVVERNEENRTPGDDYMITQIVWGAGKRGDTQAPSANVSIFIDPIDFVRYAPLYETGAHAVIPKTRAYASDQLDPKIKHYSRLNFALAEMEAKDVDPAAFPVLLDVDGNISEGTGYNFFIVNDGVLRTADDNASLQGVTRAAILETAATLGIPTSEDALQPYDVYTADEAFLCTTPFFVLPVGKIDTRTVGDEVPGPVTSQLLASLSELVGLDIVDQAKSRAAALSAERD